MSKLLCFLLLLASCSSSCVAHKPSPAVVKPPASMGYEERKGIAEGFILGRGHKSLQCAEDISTERGMCAACRHEELICFACEDRYVGCNDGDQI